MDKINSEFNEKGIVVESGKPESPKNTISSTVRPDKLIVVIMGPGKKHFAEMCLDSIKDADEVLYWTQNVSKIEYMNDIPRNRLLLFDNKWDETDSTTNGKCRQRYLKLLKKNYPDDWCLVLDEDEILDEGGITKIKEFIKNVEPGIYNVKMRHFIGDLGHEDATNLVHVVPGRLFKISEAVKYPLHSHPVLEGKLMGACLDTTIWHLGHLPVLYLDYILKRYKQHAGDSIIHTQPFLEHWRDAHLFGQYPSRLINPLELPKPLCDRYEINKDIFYFQNRGLEMKHFMMVKQWQKYFENSNVLDVGCGRGPYLFVWTYCNVESYGFDISKYAVMNSLSGASNMWVGNILEEQPNKKFNLVTAIDILEHLNYEDLDIALKNLSKLTEKNILFSIPFLGDPNLEADPTHIIKEAKDWWLDKLSNYFEIKDAPKDWLFCEQFLIGEKK